MTPTSGSSSSLLRRYIETWEGKNPPKSADGKNYIITTDPVASTNGHPNRVVGHGIDLDAGGYAAVLEAARISNTCWWRSASRFCRGLKR